MANIPQNLAFEQTRQELSKLLNYAIKELHVPFYEVELILQGFLAEVSASTRAELDASVKAYQEELAAEKAAAEAAPADAE